MVRLVVLPAVLQVRAEHGRAGGITVGVVSEAAGQAGDVLGGQDDETSRDAKDYRRR